MQTTHNFLMTVTIIATMALGGTLRGDDQPKKIEGETYTVKMSDEAVAAMNKLVAEAPEGQRAVTGGMATGSMLPVLTAEQVAILEKRPFKAIKQGDIVLVRYPAFNGVIAHRAVEKASAWAWVTKGDALKTPDRFKCDEKAYQGWVIIATVERMSGAVRTF